jgi:autotransporter-associated beta strand protein
VGNDTNNPTVALRTGGLQTLIGPASTGVNLYVVRIDFKPGNDDVYVYQNPISATEPGTPTLTMLSASDMSFNGLSMAAFDNGRTVRHDEIRVGQNWSDVVFGTSRRELVWVGNGTTNLWNLSALNWNAGSGPTAFVDGDPVTFDDTGSNTPAVSVPANVATSHVTVSNDTKNYTIGGAGSVLSSGGLLKSGTGSLTLSGTTNIGSAISMRDGSLILSGTATVGGELDIEFGDVTLSGTNTFTGNLSSAGGGNVVLSGTNTFAGLAATSTNFTVTGATTINGTGGTAVWIGNLGGADSLLTMEAGGSLTMSGSFNDAWVIGRDGGSGRVVQNGGTITYNPTNRDVAFIGASLNNPATIASYELNAGTLEMTGKRLGMAIGPITATLDQNGGTINIRQLDLGANSTTGTGIYNLVGGVMNIGAGGITSNSGLYQLNLGTGTIGATENWASTLILNLSGSTTFATGTNKVTLSGGLDGSGNLVKTGSGTLILSGFNTYTGTTTVSAGTLGGLGTSDQSTLTVASGATLAPGDGEVATFYSGGSVTLASGSTLALKIDSTSGFSDQLSTTAPLNISGATLSLSEVGLGIIPAGEQLIIIDNTGTTRTGTFAGLPQGASINAGPNSFTISYSNASQVVLTSTTVETPYQAWATSKGLDGSPGKEAGFDNDPDKDGISNGLEWVLGGDPLLADGSALIASSGSTANGLTLSFKREEASLGNVTLTLEWDTDLGGTWTSVPITQTGGAQANGVSVNVNQTSTPDEITVNIPASNAVNGHLFARLRATTP